MQCPDNAAMPCVVAQGTAAKVVDPTLCGQETPVAARAVCQ